MEGDITWSDVEDVVEAVSVRLLQDGPLTERPTKRQRLAPVSVRDPTPAPAVLPELAWSGWGELAADMGLNSAHGPAFVHGVARLHAEQRRHYALPAKERSQSMPLVHVMLQRLSATLRRAQALATQSSGQAVAEQTAQQQPIAAQPPEASGARQPLQQRWPAGVPSATQLMGSQADEPVAVGAVDYVILGKDWRARGNRKELFYLLQCQGAAAGEEDWLPVRQIKKDPRGADGIAEYERALEAGELDESQQQSQLHNPGAGARMSQQSQQGPAMPAIPEAAPQQPRTRPHASAQPQQQQQPPPPQHQAEQQQPDAAQSPARKTRDPRLQQQEPVPCADSAQAHQLQPAQQPAAGDAAAATAPRSDDDAAATEARQVQAMSQLPSQVPQSQPVPTDSQWLAGDMQIQAAPADGAALDWVPFTQGSQPQRAGDGLHRQPLPAQPSSVADPAAAGAAITAPPAAAAAAAQPAPAPTVAEGAGRPAPSAGPVVTAAAAVLQAVREPPAPQDGEAACSSDAENAPPSPEVQRGVLSFLRRLSGRALPWGQGPQQPGVAEAQRQGPPTQQQQQQQQPAEPGAQPQQLQGQQAAPQQQEPLPPDAAGAAPASGPASSQQQARHPEQPGARPGPGLAAAGGSPAAAHGEVARPSPAISIGSSDEEEDLDPELRAHLQPGKWADARITGARKDDDGMDITVTWDEDGFTAEVPNDLLKAKEHCRLKLIQFYESKIKSVSRKKKK